MNTNEPNELTPLITQPAATTRRSFIKRTASAAMIATFALGAFENEAYAATNNCSKHVIEVFPGFPYPGGIHDVPRTSFSPFRSAEWVITGTTRATILAVFSPSPETLGATLFKRDQEWHLIHNEFGVTVQVFVFLKQGTGNPQLAYTSETVDIELETHEVQNGGDPGAHTLDGTSNIQQSTEPNGDYISQLATFGGTWALELNVSVTKSPGEGGKSVNFRVECTPKLKMPQTNQAEIDFGRPWMDVPGPWFLPVTAPATVTNDDGSIGLAPDVTTIIEYPQVQNLGVGVNFALIDGDKP